MAPTCSSNNSGISTNVDVSLLKSLSKTAYIGNYKLDPHFLVLIFNIAQRNSDVKKYLESANFFRAPKMGRLDIIKNAAFFGLLSGEERNQLFPVNVFNNIASIVNKMDNITESEIAYITDNSNKFEMIDEYLYNQNIFSLARERLIPIQEVEAIIKSNRFRNILAQNSTQYAQYQQHINSRYVEYQTETGVCIDIIDIENDNNQPEREAAEEGHWKLHIGIDMERSVPAKVDVGYNIILGLMQKYNLVQLRVVAPYENVNSMKGKKFSIYLRDQMIVELSGSEENVKNFIAETESLFIKNGIIPRNERYQANKPIKSSQFFSYRNERARVLDEIPPNRNAIIRFGNKFAFSKEGKFVLSLRGDVNSLLMKPLAELNQYNIRQDQPVSTADAIRKIGS